MIKFISKHKKIATAGGILAVVLALVYFAPIKELKTKPVCSYALYDKMGRLLGAKVAADGQWRFEKGAVPSNFEKAIITFEDKRFYHHLGIDPFSIARAIVLNTKNKRIVSGGSTLTMQTVRLLEKNPPRTIRQKMREAAVSLIIEIRWSKKRILETYCANAPFGGNVVGLEAASWRYFGRPPESLSWAECATLAVLPNQPSLVYPGANSEILLAKRDRLLKKLYEKKYIDLKEYELALLEPLPKKPYNLPQITPHYLELLKKNASPSQTKFYTDIDSSLQKNVTRILEDWSSLLYKRGINNAAALVIETKTGNVLAYCANTGFVRNKYTRDVDLIQSPRSSGSLLKPFLFAAMLDSGQLLPEQLVVDIPTRIGNYHPDNNVPQYKGALPASEALSRSLNIPAIRELREYGVNAFLSYLQKCGFTTLNRGADFYGLPLILGGGEVTLWESTFAYAAMMNKAAGCKTNFPARRGAAYLTLDALVKGTRPAEEANWQIFANSKKIAWKTGTSSGNRDTWAIGTTPEYTVGIWIGNAEGYGVADLKSVSTSAPVLFDIFSALPTTTWPETPWRDMTEETVCAKSGYMAGPYCAETKKIWRAKNAPISKACPYCKLVSFTPDGKYQASAEDLTGIYTGQMPLMQKWFVLPTNIEYWYKKANIGYRSLPDFVPWHKGSSANEISILFPEEGSHLIIPIDLNGKKGMMVMQATARSLENELFWDLDGEFLGATTTIHQMGAAPSVGKHKLTITDKNGNRKTRIFEIIPADYE